MKNYPLVSVVIPYYKKNFSLKKLLILFLIKVIRILK